MQDNMDDFKQNIIPESSQPYSSQETIFRKQLFWSYIL